LIVGLKEQDIISGLYPRLKQEDMERGIEMGIIVGPDNSSYKGLYDIKVDVLRRLMEEMEKKSISREFGHQSLQHLAGVADRVTDLTAHGKIPQSHNTNPMGS
jgi:hypothetical protein